MTENEFEFAVLNLYCALLKRSSDSSCKRLRPNIVQFTYDDLLNKKILSLVSVFPDYSVAYNNYCLVITVYN